LRANFCLWGGQFNPIIPFEDEDLSRHLIALFRVDVLLPGDPSDANAKAFIKKCSHLPNPFYGDGVFFPDDEGVRGPRLLDVLHPMRRDFEEKFKNVASPKTNVVIRTWESTDVLADVLLATFGEYPAKEESGFDYASFIKNEFPCKVEAIPLGAELPRVSENSIGISSFSRTFLSQHYRIDNHRSQPGFYIGDCSSFEDLVNFWNLRACNIALAFVDPSFGQRFSVRRESWLEMLAARPRSRFELDDAVAIWTRDRSNFDKSKFGTNCVLNELDPVLWNGLNLRAPYMYFSEGRTLASVSSGKGEQPRVTFQLPKKPIEQEKESYEQHFVMGIDPGIGLFGNEKWTLKTPFLPELNEYYGRECFFDWRKARVEPEGLGVIASVTTDHVTINSLNVSALIKRIFAEYGIEAQPSKSGLIATRLIEQMGGIQACRVFQIGGVRSLIEQHKPSQSFTRGQATKTIWGEGTASPLSKFKNLYIEANQRSGKLDSETVFSFLLRKEVFRAGLKLMCPNCSLEFWTSLDDTRTQCICEYCGSRFNITPQLKDRDWAFRRSGLFGRDDHQEGSIPVVLTLQQLDSIFAVREFVYASAMSLNPVRGGASTDPCETDFVALVPQSRSNRIGLIIGECKTRKPIEEADVSHLKAIADVFPEDRFDVHVLFSKLAPFSTEELRLVARINAKRNRRAIILTPDQLESWRLFSEADAGGKRPVVSLSDLADASHDIFLKSL
jgi:DNA-directed RNA polymerase subunit RPC12/RpoP